MFPIQVTMTLHRAEQLAQLQQFVNSLVGIAATVTAAEKAAVLQEQPTTGDGQVAGGKPSAAATAPSPRTAAPTAAPAPTASPQTSASASSATTPPAPAPAAEGEFKYETLQKAVNAAVPKHGKDKLLAIAKAHGADNFKGLPADKWAAAHADVLALGV